MPWRLARNRCGTKRLPRICWKIRIMPTGFPNLLRWWLEPRHIIHHRRNVPWRETPDLLHHLGVRITALAKPDPLELAHQVLKVLPLDQGDIILAVTLSAVSMAINSVLLVELLAILQIHTRTNTVVWIHR